MECLKNFDGITYYNKKYFLVKSKSKELWVYNEDYKLINKIYTFSAYKSITYVHSTKEFYLISRDDNKSFYILNNNLQLIKKISINLPLTSLENINHITYYDDNVLVTTNTAVYLVSLKGEYLKTIYTTINYKLDDCKDKLKQNQIILLSSIYFNNKLYITYKQNYTYYIGEVINDLEELICLGEFQIFTLFVENDLFYLQECRSGYQKITKIDIKPEKEIKTNISSSITKLENGLASIITTEMEKFKSFVNKSTGVEDLINLNESLSKLLLNITILEDSLLEKKETK